MSACLFVNHHPHVIGLGQRLRDPLTLSFHVDEDLS